MEIKENDVVQIVPEHKWSGCLAVVSEVRSWGVQAYVEIPMQGSAHIRLNSDEYEKVGVAVFVRGE